MLLFTSFQKTLLGPLLQPLDPQGPLAQDSSFNKQVILEKAYPPVADCVAARQRGPNLDFGRLIVQADVALHSAKQLGRSGNVD